MHPSNDKVPVPIGQGQTKTISVSKFVLSDVKISTSDTHTGKIYVEQLDQRFDYTGPLTEYQITFTTDSVNISNLTTPGTPDIDVEITKI
jgi:hypothetical protein